MLSERAGAVLFGVEARPNKGQRGLFATRQISKDSVLLRVPEQACMVLNYDTGLMLHDAPYPNLRRGLEADEPLPWDLLFALALVDSLAGDGDPFYAEYGAKILPHPDALTMPFCQSPQDLELLQHRKVIQAATAQQERLAAAFPDLSATATDLLPDVRPRQRSLYPTALQWAFAAIRSRAFQISEATFAFVPFLDVANHAAQPTADFRAVDIGATGDDRRGKVELVALEELHEGDEVTISYTGPRGATNRRLMVQYGFVTTENASDRLDLGLTSGYIGTKPLRGPPGAALSLSRLQERMGDMLFNGMLAGKAPALLCALKSLPTYDMAADELPNPEQVLAEESGVLDTLETALDAVFEDFSSSLEDDEDELSAKTESMTAWEEEALRYRIEHKRLAAAARSLLNLYRQIIAEGV